MKAIITIVDDRGNLVEAQRLIEPKIHCVNDEYDEYLFEHRIFRCREHLRKDEPHAHWKYWEGWMSNHDMRLEYECSCCGHKGCIRGHGIKNIQFLPEYCPSCKSKMDEVSE